jgi:excisionase family DNA binding protein
MSDHNAMTIKEAMSYLRLSDSTIRRMLDEGVLKGLGKEKGRIVIDRNSIEDVALALGRGQLTTQELRREISPTLKGLADLIQGLTQSINQKDERMIELAKELGEAQALARRLPNAEQEINRLRAELEEARQQLTELRASKTN